MSALYRLRDWQNIGRKLPVMTTVLLSAAVTVIFWTAYSEMKRAAVKTASDHLLSVSHQISNVFAVGFVRELSRVSSTQSNA